MLERVEELDDSLAVGTEIPRVAVSHQAGRTSIAAMTTRPSATPTTPASHAFQSIGPSAAP